LLLYFLLFAVLYTIVVAACVGLLFVARNYGAGLAPNLAFHGRSAAVVGAAAIALVVLAWFWLSMLRLLFLLAPIASVEHRLRLSRAWQLTGGSTLRTFIVLVVVFLPVMIVAWAANRFVLHIGTIGLQPHATPMEVVTHVLAFYGANAGSLALISAALAVLNGALLAGASAAAYRTVTHHEEAEPEDDAALVAPLLLAEEPHPVDDRHLEPDHAVAPVAQHGHDHDNRDHADVDPDDEHGRTDDNHGHGDADSMPQGAHSHADGNVAHDGHGHEAHADQAHAHEDHSAHGEGHHHHDGEHPGHATAHDGTEHASGGDGVDPIHSKSELVARAA
jgi:hypothetical protein